MSATPDQLHELLMHCIGFARTMLEAAGEFYPFGAALSPSGQIAAVGAHTGEERPAPQELYKLLAEGFAAGARNGEYAATALAANVDIPAEYAPPSPDGLRVHLESAGYSRFVYVPYRVKKSGVFRTRRAAEFAEPFAVEVPPQAFRADSRA
jgi:hypothetical protein